MRKYLKIMAAIMMFCAVSTPHVIHAEDVSDGESSFRPCVMETPEEDLVDPNEPEIAFYTLPQNYEEYELYDQLEERIKDALLNGEDTVDIYDLQISRGAYKPAYIKYYSPYISNGIDVRFSYFASNNLYSAIAITNPMTLEETVNYINAVDAKVSAILNLVSDDMPADQKALIIHDYFVYEYEYDYENTNNNTLPDDAFRSGGIFMKGTGVCQAYAYGYEYIMSQLGIECYVTGSTEMNHAWNIIKIDGNCYHVDCTWDDIAPDRLGQVSHQCLLVSDQKIREMEHTGWDLTNLVCNSNAYENAYWRNILSQIITVGDSVYYIEGNSIYKRNLTNQAVTKLKQLGTWKMWGNNGSYSKVFSGLFLYNNELYYNTSTEIRKMSLTGANDTVVFTPDTSNGYIYGIRKSGNELQYIIRKSSAEMTNKLSVSLDKTGNVSAKNGWAYENNTWFYYKQGAKVTGWLNLNGTWYYLNGSGAMVTGWLNLNGTWYYLYDWGAMATGWLNLNGTWYYLYDWGAMATGWLNLNGTWYYLYDWGAMATGWLNLNGTWYYLYDWGAMATEWLNLNGTWYYLQDWGAMATGWLNLNGTWYYLYDWGAMATGWLNLNGTWYYLYDWGAMAADCWIGNYYVGGDGSWLL